MNLFDTISSKRIENLKVNYNILKNYNDSSINQFHTGENIKCWYKKEYVNFECSNKKYTALIVFKIYDKHVKLLKSPTVHCTYSIMFSNQLNSYIYLETLKNTTLEKLKNNSKNQNIYTLIIQKMENILSPLLERGIIYD